MFFKFRCTAKQLPIKPQTATGEKYTELGPSCGRIGGERSRMEASLYSEAFRYDRIRKL